MHEPFAPKADYDEVKRVLSRALDLPRPERRAWIGEHAKDPGVQAEVLALLDQAEGLGGFLETPARLGRQRPEPVAPETLPSEIGGHTIERLLGIGGMGIVYLARQAHPQREVALKVLLGGGGDPRDQLDARFRREVEALGRLRHPGIAQVYEVGEYEDEHGQHRWFSMEHVEGVSLREHWRGRRREPRELVELVARIADVVAYAHDHGVLHRDLKPENVLITGDGAPKVLDFGVARLRGDEHLPSLHTLTGAVVGTIAYMSPEQSRGDAVDERTDVFSLGAILYELLVGRVPYEARGRSLHQLVRSLAEDEPTPLSSHDRNLAGDLEAVVHTAIEPDLRRRYPDARAFAADLRRWLERRPVRARPPTLLDQARKLVARNRKLAVAALVTFSSLAIALVLAIGSARVTSLRNELLANLNAPRQLDELHDRVERLWPIGPELVPRLERWLAEVDDLRRNRARHAAFLGRLRAGSVSVPATTDSAKLAADLERFLRRLDQLESTDPPGLLPRVRARLEESRSLFARTVEEHRSEWDATIAAIRDIEANPFYGGLVIEPQVGLIPLGQDPSSRLFEFALHLPGCHVPERDPETGRLERHPLATVVFVLLPGGETTFGAQGVDPSLPNYFRRTAWHEGPVQEAWLFPFFLAKTEVTQAQWTAQEAQNVAYWHAGKSGPWGFRLTLDHPAEYMDWAEAVAFARRLGCRLPTEVQWEYGARSGSPTPLANFLLEEVPNRANLADSYYASQEHGIPGTDIYWIHGPVGCFPPNPFGLYDVLGNVSEACVDDYKIDYASPLRNPGDGRVLAWGSGEYAVRGGHMSSEPDKVHLGWRGDRRFDFRSFSMGMRLARTLAGYEPPPVPVPYPAR